MVDAARNMSEGAASAMARRFLGRAMKVYLGSVLVTETALAGITPFLVARFQDAVANGMYEADQVHPFVQFMFDRHWATLAITCLVYLVIGASLAKPALAWAGATVGTLLVLAHFVLAMAFFVLVLAPAYSYQPLG